MHKLTFDLSNAEQAQAFTNMVNNLNDTNIDITVTQNGCNATIQWGAN